MKKVLAALGTAAVLAVGATGCGTGGLQYSGYDQVWDHGHYVYVPDSYYHSHRSLYSGHPVHHVSSSYVTTHHVTVSHQTTVHSNGSRTTTRTTTRHTTTTTRKSGGWSRSGGSTRSYRKR